MATGNSCPDTSFAAPTEQPDAAPLRRVACGVWLGQAAVSAWRSQRSQMQCRPWTGGTFSPAIAGCRRPAVSTTPAGLVVPFPRRERRARWTTRSSGNQDMFFVPQDRNRIGRESDRQRRYRGGSTACMNYPPRAVHNTKSRCGEESPLGGYALLGLAAAALSSLPALLLTDSPRGVRAPCRVPPEPDGERSREGRHQALAVRRTTGGARRPVVGRGSCLEALSACPTAEVVQRHPQAGLIARSASSAVG